MKNVRDILKSKLKKIKSDDTIRLELLEMLEILVRQIEDSAEATAYFGVLLAEAQELIEKARAGVK